MPFLSTGELKYIKKYLTIFFLKILDWEIFQATLGKFRGNSDWDWGQILAPNGVQ